MGGLLIPVANIDGPLSGGSTISSVDKLQELCNYIPFNGQQSITRLCISNHRMITDYE